MIFVIFRWFHSRETSESWEILSLEKGLPIYNIFFGGFNVSKDEFFEEFHNAVQARFGKRTTKIIEDEEIEEVFELYLEMGGEEDSIYPNASNEAYAYLGFEKPFFELTDFDVKCTLCGREHFSKVILKEEDDSTGDYSCDNCDNLITIPVLSAIESSRNR